ncbi:hypothetical protein CEXT_536051 [Caerostris extrusa]|uniref:Uncharacterized protein n=1 Tax=Caerostris extrusa TaxID=172846 RepID=A0AAV4Q694_CAEEX|nr:hypothetical protein CEXT_536051 [Caerostris extrusa]
MGQLKGKSFEGFPTPGAGCFRPAPSALVRLASQFPGRKLAIFLFLYQKGNFRKISVSGPPRHKDGEKFAFFFSTDKKNEI